MAASIAAGLYSSGFVALKGQDEFGQAEMGASISSEPGNVHAAIAPSSASSHLATSGNNYLMEHLWMDIVSVDRAPDPEQTDCVGIASSSVSHIGPGTN